MPEGPEVEATRSMVEKYCLGASLQDVVIVEQGGGPRHGLIDDRVCSLSKDDISFMLNRKVKQVQRRGKYFWIDFSSGCLLFHLGMTGSVSFCGKKVPSYKAFKVSLSWPPKFTKLMLIFSNGEKLAFCDPRRLGRVQLIEDPLHSPPVCKLAPDPLIDGISSDLFSEKLARYSCPIKSMLLNQEILCCGIGNWVADEVLYHSCIHPETRCNAIASNPKSVSKLIESILSVLHVSVNANANDEAFPSDWLFHKRWDKRKTNCEQLTSKGEAISFITVGGRTSAVVLSRQKKLSASQCTKKNPVEVVIPSISKKSSGKQKDRSSLQKEESNNVKGRKCVIEVETSCDIRTAVTRSRKRKFEKSDFKEKRNRTKKS